MIDTQHSISDLSKFHQPVGCESFQHIAFCCVMATRKKALALFSDAACARHRIKQAFFIPSILKLVHKADEISIYL